MTTTERDDSLCDDPSSVLKSQTAQPLNERSNHPRHDKPIDREHSLLDPVETSTDRISWPVVSEHEEARPGTEAEDSTNDEARFKLVADFRHSFWADRRTKVRESLYKVTDSEETLKRFDACGSNCWVMKATDNSGRLRLSADRCHNRWCEACASEKRRLICRNLTHALTEQKTAGDRLRFMTVTLAHTSTPLTDQLDRIYDCWTKLREHPKIKKHVAGTIAFFEVKISAADGRWHPHIHALVDGTYIAKEVLSATWKEITGDSFIVDIKQIRNPAAAAGYIAKYAAKAICHTVWRNKDRLEEAMFALRSRRLFNTSGTFRAMNLSKPPADDVGWEAVAPLSTLILRARNGDVDAVHILRALRCCNAENPIDADVRTGPSPPMPHLPD